MNNSHIPTCQICEKVNTKFFYKIEKYSYYSCTNCVTLFLYPKPTRLHIDNYYKKNFKYSAGESNEKTIRLRSRKITARLKKINPGGKTLLDIGSGYGYFLSEAGRGGLTAMGIEPSKNLIDVSINQLIDTKILNTTLDNYYLLSRNRKFDFITLIHVIEHVFNPKETIEKALKLLNPNGVLYVETPNLDSHLFYVESKKYTFLTPPDHLWIFSKKSFKKIMKNISNIDSVIISTYSYPEHFMGIIKTILKYRKRQNGLTGRVTQKNDKFIPRPTKGLKYLKYLLFDKLVAYALQPLLNIGNKGSFLELYIRKK